MSVRYRYWVSVGYHNRKARQATSKPHTGCAQCKIMPAPSASECRSGGINDAEETQDACKMLKRCHIGFLQCHAVNEDALIMLCIDVRGALRYCSGQA